MNILKRHKNMNNAHIATPVTTTEIESEVKKVLGNWELGLGRFYGDIHLTTQTSKDLNDAYILIDSIKKTLDGDCTKYKISNSLFDLSNMLINLSNSNIYNNIERIEDDANMEFLAERAEKLKALAERVKDGGIEPKISEQGAQQFQSISKIFNSKDSSIPEILIGLKSIEFRLDNLPFNQDYDYIKLLDALRKNTIEWNAENMRGFGNEQVSVVLRQIDAIQEKLNKNNMRR
jgi:hypothetical protein